MKNILRILLIGLVVVFLFNVQNSFGQFFVFVNSLVGQDAPAFQLENLEGQMVSLEDFSDGGNTILFFWATWCPHCRAAIVELNKMKDSFEDNGVKLLLVDVGESKLRVEKFLSNSDIGFDTLLDVNSSAANTYGVMGLPTFVYIGKDGKVREAGHELYSDYDKVFSKDLPNNANE